MNELRNILEEVRAGKLDVEGALRELRHFPAESMAHACLDYHRRLRTGIPEVVYGESKTAEQLVAILMRMQSNSRSPVLATRVDDAKAAVAVGRLSRAVYHADARMITVGDAVTGAGVRGVIGVISAGTSDLPVAEEAAVTAGFLGHPVERLYDVGVAGIHRLFAGRDLFDRCTVLVVVAGMEGALPSVIGGLVDKPVIAVPTSVGYGTGFGGIAALLAMLNSCAPGVAVVNIDNGFGAACAAMAINRK
ncbi:MAG: nickel pincer cofactor biosynthesis protein LarB [Thermodesulfobacteriota bacterium]